MKFRYPTDKEFEMAGRLYYFEHTHFYNVSPLHRELINDSNRFPAWIKAHACDAFVTEDGHGICCLTPNIDGSKYVKSDFSRKKFSWLHWCEKCHKKYWLDNRYPLIDYLIDTNTPLLQFKTDPIQFEEGNKEE